MSPPLSPVRPPSADSDTVDVLLHGRPAPTVVRTGEPLRPALRLMLEQSFSQLPVVGAADAPVGILTLASALRSLEHVQATTAQLRVSDAMLALDPDWILSQRETVWTALDRLRRRGALMVVEPGGRLVGVVTDSDAAAFLRDRAREHMIVGAIEQRIRDLVFDAYQRDRAADLERDVDRVVNGGWHKQIQALLGRFVARYDPNGKMAGQLRPSIDAIVAQQAPPAPDFERLTLGHYTELLLSDVCWRRYGPRISFDKVALREVLDAVRQTRNDLAHLRGARDHVAKDRLVWLRDWLDRTLGGLLDEPYAEVEPVAVEPAQVASVGPAPAGAVEAAVEPGAGPAEAEPEGEPESEAAWLAPLRQLLMSQSARMVEVSLSTLSETDGLGLPKAALEDRQWWSNLAPHADAWLSAGYSVAAGFMNQGKVRFVRDEARNRRYLRVFREVARRLEETAHRFEPKANSWVRLGWLKTADGSGHAVTAAYARGSRFRLRLTLDTGDADANRELFERLRAHETALQARFDKDLEWHALADRRASVVELFAPGAHHIDDEPERQAELVDWAVAQIPRFVSALGEALGAVEQPEGAA